MCAGYITLIGREVLVPSRTRNLPLRCALAVCVAREEHVCVRVCIVCVCVGGSLCD